MRQDRLRDSLDDFGRSILEAGDRDVPAPGARKALLKALVGTGVAVTATTAAAGGTTATTVAPLAAKGALTATKVILALAVSAGGIGTAHYVMTKSEDAPAKVQPTSQSAPPTVAKKVELAPVETQSDAPSSNVEIPNVEAPTVEPRRPAPIRNHVIEPAPTMTPRVEETPPPEEPAAQPESNPKAETPKAVLALRAEVALLDRARKAVREGRPAEARRALDEYERRFPEGSLRVEARDIRRSAER